MIEIINLNLGDRTSDINFALKLNYKYEINKFTISGNLFETRQSVFYYKSLVSLYISYELDVCSRNLETHFTLGNLFSEAVKLTKNVDPDKCKYSSYGIELDSYL